MKVKHMRDVVVLSLIKDGAKSRSYIEKTAGIRKNISGKSIHVLAKNGFIVSYKLNGNEYYHITENGKKFVDVVFNFR